MKMKDTILEYISGLIQKKGKLPANCDIAEFNYIDTGHIDSIAIIKFVLDIETKFNIEITDEDMMTVQFRTVGGLVCLIASKTNTD